MWINNYDDEEMDIATALMLLTVNGWMNAPRASDIVDDIEYVFVSPDNMQYQCKDDNEVIDLVEGQGLMFPEVTQ